MENFILEMEVLQGEAEGLTGICQAIADAMLYSPNQVEGYLKGFDLFTTLLYEHANKMNDKIREAIDERGTANE